MHETCIQASTDYCTKLFLDLPQALSTYGSDSQMTSLLDKMDVFVLPVFNVDGYDFTHKSVCHNQVLLKLKAMLRRLS